MTDKEARKAMNVSGEFCGRNILIEYVRKMRMHPLSTRKRRVKVGRYYQ